MKLIFLDVDGVLVTPKSLAISPDKHMRSFDRDCVENLNKLVEESGASLILSSTWRLLMPLEVFNDHARRNYLNHKVIDITTSESLFTREAEIQTYLFKVNQSEPWICIDDMQLKLGNKLILTKNENGLTESDVKDALQILKTEEYFKNNQIYR